jgi:acyl carrier protein
MLPKVDPAGPPPIISTSVFLVVIGLQRVGGLLIECEKLSYFLRWPVRARIGNRMQTQTEQEREVAELIVATLNLEDTNAGELAPDQPLFGDGLGLDSIDALELALAISQKYSVQLKADDKDMQQAFATLRSLSKFIEENA